MSALSEINHFMVTLVSRSTGEQSAFWVTSKTELLAVKKAIKFLGEPADVVSIVSCNGSPARKVAVAVETSPD